MTQLWDQLDLERKSREAAVHAAKIAGLKETQGLLEKARAEKAEEEARWAEVEVLLSTTKKTTASVQEESVLC